MIEHWLWIGAFSQTPKLVSSPQNLDFQYSGLPTLTCLINGAANPYMFYVGQILSTFYYLNVYQDLHDYQAGFCFDPFQKLGRNLSKIQVAFWAMEFREKLLLRFTDLQQVQEKIKKTTCVSFQNCMGRQGRFWHY